MGAGQFRGATPHGTGAGAPLREALRTARLDLRLFDHGDVPELHEILGDPATNTIGTGPMRSSAETRAWVERRQQTFVEHGIAWYAVRIRTTGQLLGHCGMMPGRTGAAAPEIGYMIRIGARGNGYAAESAAAVVDECRAAGLPRIWATIRPGNLASRHIVEQLGLRLHHVTTDDRGELCFYDLGLLPTEPCR